MIRVMERRGLSQRHACELVGLDRSTLRYRCRRPDDSVLRQRLRELAAERRRFGYRRLGWMLAREGHALNHKKLYRLYREERLMVRRRRGRKRALGTRAPMALPIRINQRWSLDFVSDTLSDGRRFRILCVVDDFSRECLATVVDTSLGGVRVVRELSGSRSNERCRRRWLAIMGRNSPVVRCCAGQPEGSRGTTSSRANQCKTPSSNHSIASCATSALTITYSAAWEKRARSSRRGGTTTTTCARTRVSATWRRRSSRSSAVARTAWPAKQMLAGTVQGAPTSDPKPDSFSAALRGEGRPEKLG